MNIHKLIYLLLLSVISTAFSFAEDSIPENLLKQTLTFAQKDTSELKMDIYRLKVTTHEKQPVMIFMFGGGFKGGKRNDPYYNNYFITLASQGITTISIDYRLGLVDQKITLFNTKAADFAINMAVEDLFSATRYVIDHAEELNIDPDCIMISGSSAGAVTVLQADYYLNNKMHSYEILPAGFHYAGVLSFAGAIFSHRGTPDYKEKPAPTLFLHGDKDKVVFYNKLRLFRRGMFGSRPLAKRFKKREFNYLFITMKNKGHSVSGSPMHHNLDVIEWFIKNYVYEKKNWQNEGCMKELNTPIEASGSVWAL